jgi:hexosaminidase
MRILKMHASIKVECIVLTIVSAVFLIAPPSQADSSQPIAIIPQPQKLIRVDGEFVLNQETAILADKNSADAGNVARQLADHINRATGLGLTVAASDATIAVKNAILLTTHNAITSLPAEGYTLEVTPEHVVISAADGAGLFYGVQTLLQLFPTQIESGKPVENFAWKIPCVEITDFPRFAWRGLLLDVSRHFFTKEALKQYIDVMARYKFNTLQLHLTDDQGWRIEIKKYPKLTEVGAWRVPGAGVSGPPKPDEKPTYGGFYTQQDIRELVQYAQSRFVTIVPEIEMPGHTMAALAAYPQLSCTGGPFFVPDMGCPFYGKIQNTLCMANEGLYEYVEGVLTEVAELFPGRYVHIGCDEVFRDFWRDCPKCQKLKEKLGITKQYELMNYFVNRTAKFLESKGKTLIAWDEVLDGGRPLDPAVSVMSWRGTEGGIIAAKTGHRVVMTPSPYYYIDLYQGEPSIEPPTYGINRLSTCYGFEPVPENVDPKFILGVQGNLWSEAVSDPKHAQYMTWPRGFAVAETGWSGKDRKNWSDFVRRVEHQFTRLELEGVYYSTSMFNVILKPKKDVNGSLVIELATEVEGLDIHYTLDGTNPTISSSKYIQPLSAPSGAEELRVLAFRDNRPIGRQINMPIAELQKRADQK